MKASLLNILLVFILLLSGETQCYRPLTNKAFGRNFALRDIAGDSSNYDDLYMKLKSKTSSTTSGTKSIKEDQMTKTSKLQSTDMPPVSTSQDFLSLPPMTFAIVSVVIGVTLAAVFGRSNDSNIEEPIQKLPKVGEPIEEMPGPNEPIKNLSAKVEEATREMPKVVEKIQKTLEVGNKLSETTPVVATPLDTTEEMNNTTNEPSEPIKSDLADAPPTEIEVSPKLKDLESKLENASTETDFANALLTLRAERTRECLEAKRKRKETLGIPHPAAPNLNLPRDKMKSISPAVQMDNRSFAKPTAGLGNPELKNPTELEYTKAVALELESIKDSAMKDLSERLRKTELLQSEKLARKTEYSRKAAIPKTHKEDPPVTETMKSTSAETPSTVSEVTPSVAAPTEPKTEEPVEKKISEVISSVVDSTADRKAEPIVDDTAPGAKKEEVKEVQEKLAVQQKDEEREMKGKELDAQEEFFQLIDEMQLASQKYLSDVEGAQQLEIAVQSMAKLPLPRIREMVKGLDLLAEHSSAVLTGEDSLEAHLRVLLKVLWSSSGADWKKFIALTEAHVKPEAQKNSMWLEKAVAAGKEINDSRLKIMIKERGGLADMPKRNRKSIDPEAGQGGKKKGGLQKIDFVGALMGLLSAELENDYQQVAAVLEREFGASGDKKGFSTGFSKKQQKYEEMAQEAEVEEAESAPEVKIMQETESTVDIITTASLPQIPCFPELEAKVAKASSDAEEAKALVELRAVRTKAALENKRKRKEALGIPHPAAPSLNIPALKTKSSLPDIPAPVPASDAIKELELAQTPDPIVLKYTEAVTLETEKIKSEALQEMNARSEVTKKLQAEKLKRKQELSSKAAAAKQPVSTDEQDSPVFEPTTVSEDKEKVKADTVDDSAIEVQARAEKTAAALENKKQKKEALGMPYPAAPDLNLPQSKISSAPTQTKELKTVPMNKNPPVKEERAKNPSTFTQEVQHNLDQRSIATAKAQEEKLKRKSEFVAKKKSAEPAIIEQVEASKEATPKKPSAPGLTQTELEAQEEFFRLIDEMQVAATRYLSDVEGAKQLEIAVQTMAKLPLLRIRELVSGLDLLTEQSAWVLKPEDSLEAHLRVLLKALWSSSGGDWKKFISLVNAHVNSAAESNSKWLEKAVAAGKQISDSRLKIMIKERGGLADMPKRNRKSIDPEAGQGGKKKGGLQKIDFVGALMGLLSAELENDYQQVAAVLEREAGASGDKKGFSSGAGFSKSRKN